MPTWLIQPIDSAIPTYYNYSLTYAPVNWNPCTPLNSGLSGGLRGIHIPYRVNLAGRSKINLLISWPPTVFFNQCVTLGNNKLLIYKGSFTKFYKVVLQREFYKGSRGGGMHHSLLSPVTGDFTHFHLHKKWVCPTQARMGGWRGFKWLVHYAFIIPN